RLRDAERRLAMGDLARQVNHDIKNGLIPIRNVFRHLGQAAGDSPDRLAAAFRDRQATVESSISYLENLASNYARLYPQPAGESCDVNAVVRETISRVSDTGQAELRLELAEGLRPARTDALVLRRILENLVGNALDSLAARAGHVTVSTAANGQGGVRITVADTGKGMTQDELNRAFDDFYTTKPGGTGLGLSIVRRLVLDANGATWAPDAGARLHRDGQLRPLHGGHPARRPELHRQGRADGTRRARGRARARAAAPRGAARRPAGPPRFRGPARGREPRHAGAQGRDRASREAPESGPDRGRERVGEGARRP